MFFLFCHRVEPRQPGFQISSQQLSGFDSENRVSSDISKYHFFTSSRCQIQRCLKPFGFVSSFFTNAITTWSSFETSGCSEISKKLLPGRKTTARNETLNIFGRMVSHLWAQIFVMEELPISMMQFDCDKLSSEWDSHEDIRNRLRNGLDLVCKKDKSKDASIAQCVANMDVLPPLLHRLYACGLKMPEINPLKDQCEKSYTLSSRDIDEATIDDDAWELRKMCRFIKRKANRQEVSLEPRK